MKDRPSFDSAEAMRVKPPIPEGDLFAQAGAAFSAIPEEERRRWTEGSWDESPKPAPHTWALTAIRRDIRHTAEAMDVFTSEDVRDRMTHELGDCVDLVPNLMGQAFKEAAKANEIRVREDLPSVISQREDAKGRRLLQWSRCV